MTNPSDAVGTNGAYGGRTSVDALNDVLGCFKGAGVLSGWNVRAGAVGMTVMIGGQAGIRDVAVAQDQLGDRTTINNRLGSPIVATLSASSPSTARVDSVVLYVNKPASVSTTTIDNPEACGIIIVSGTTVAPSEADIRSAITADGGTGATAYYVVIADITVPASATVITNTNITNYSGKLLAGSSLADSTITPGKIDWSTMYVSAAMPSANVEIPTGNAVNIQTITLPAGKWRVCWGYRYAHVKSTVDYIESGLRWGGNVLTTAATNVPVDSSGNGRIIIAQSFEVNPAGPTTYSSWVNSTVAGVAGACRADTCFLYAMRVG